VRPARPGGPAPAIRGTLIINPTPLAACGRSSACGSAAGTLEHSACGAREGARNRSRSGRQAWPALAQFFWHHQDAHEIHFHGESLTYKAGRAGTNQVSVSAVQLLFERPWCWPLAHYPEVVEVFTPAWASWCHPRGAPRAQEPGEGLRVGRHAQRRDGGGEGTAAVGHARAAGPGQRLVRRRAGRRGPARHGPLQLVRALPVRAPQGAPGCQSKL